MLNARLLRDNRHTRVISGSNHCVAVDQETLACIEREAGCSGFPHDFDRLHADDWNIEYGRTVARGLAQYDIGQTVVVAESACVAVEAMEGTDATIERAGQLMATLGPGHSTLARELTVVKVSKPKQDMRFDVPVVGVKTIEVMRKAVATCLALDAGKCLLIDGNTVTVAADAAGITMVAE